MAILTRLTTQMGTGRFEPGWRNPLLEPPAWRRKRKTFGMRWQCLKLRTNRVPFGQITI